jgi:hypothetical protein
MGKKKVTGGQMTSTPLATAILANESRLHEGIDYCLQHLKGQAWPEWETTALQAASQDPSFLDMCIDYADRVRNASWPELEVLLLENAKDFTDGRPALDYATRVLRGRWRELEPLLFNEWDDLVTYMKKFIHGRWEFLENAVVSNDYPMSSRSHAILAYCRLCRKCRWKEAEPILVQGFSGGKHAKRYALEYAEEFMDGDLSEWDAKVLQGDYHASVTVEYAIATKGGHWADLEQAVGSKPHEDDWSRSVVVEYAERVLKGQWTQEEHRLMGSAKHLMEYADRLNRGRLPDDLHEAMRKHRVLDIDNTIVDAYCKKYGY